MITKMHLGKTAFKSLSQCQRFVGRGNTTTRYNKVTCGSCKRTKRYKRWEKKQ